MENESIKGEDQVKNGPSGDTGEERERINRSRKLLDNNKVWEHNSWDDVEWDEVREAEAKSIVDSQLSASPYLKDEQAVDIMVQGPAAAQWDRFYTQHSRWFFKDRKWLSSEFPEIFDSNFGLSIMEVGCGAGNTIFPIARARLSESGLKLYACDFAPTAIDLVKNFREYDPARMTVFLHDLANDESFSDIPDNSIDIVIAIFVLSALDPSRLPFALSKIFRILSPGGLLLFRDYGKYDLTQLRFKASRLIRPDLYIRGDGTAVHYFTLDEIYQLATNVGFEVKSNTIDRRLLVNRFRKLTMYRVWIQSKLRKPPTS